MTLFCAHIVIMLLCFNFNFKGRQGQVRLVDGSIETEGRVQFFDKNTWKTLCSDDWGIEEVQSTCRQLGLPEPSSAVPPGGSFGRNGAGDTLPNSIICTGQELTLQNCSWTARAMPCSTGGAGAQCGMRPAGKDPNQSPGWEAIYGSSLLTSGHSHLELPSEELALIDGNLHRG